MHRPPESNGHRLLVVDDEPPIVFALSRYFRNLGYEVDCTGELEEAQALIECRDYSVVLADLQLRKVSGVEGLELLRHARRRSPLTPIVLLTAYGSPEIEAEAAKLGAAAFLHKPEPLEKIAAIVRDLADETCGQDKARRRGLD